MLHHQDVAEINIDIPEYNLGSVSVADQNNDAAGGDIVGSVPQSNYENNSSSLGYL